MWFLTIVCVLSVGTVYCNDASWYGKSLSTMDNDALANTEIVLAFVIFRHGDRTPDQEELDLYPSEDKLSKDVFFPYGLKSLTNRGKQREFEVGKYLRKRYDGFISQLYLSDEIEVTSTNYARTQMSALAALAGLYPPPPAQKWNPALNWQPVPYNTPPLENDDLLYYYNCPAYIEMRNKVYEDPEFRKLFEPYQDLLVYLQRKTGHNITTPEDVFYLDNLFQTLNNVGVKTPDWAIKVMPQIKEVTKLEYAAEFYTDDLIRLSSGVLLYKILNATNAYIAGDREQTKLRVFSAHENNVAALMAAVKVFEPHQPNYGATFTLELRRLKNGQYGVSTVYARHAGGPGKALLVKGCDNLLCDYNKFVTLVKDYALDSEDHKMQCQ